MPNGENFIQKIENSTFLDNVKDQPKHAVNLKKSYFDEIFPKI